MIKKGSENKNKIRYDFKDNSNRDKVLQLGGGEQPVSA
jgi:hypothetical protein